mmetsp:Transcript_1992/g.3799  ORF Transcript_1992/g.3799 Transcript_1992/m.3799 type:complete len:1002 (+) Transcript_1992:572-3577(+)
MNNNIENHENESIASASIFSSSHASSSITSASASGGTISKGRKKRVGGGSGNSKQKASSQSQQHQHGSSSNSKQHTTAKQKLPQSQLKSSGSSGSGGASVNSGSVGGGGGHHDHGKQAAASSASAAAGAAPTQQGRGRERRQSSSNHNSSSNNNNSNNNTNNTSSSGGGILAMAGRSLRSLSRSSRSSRATAAALDLQSSTSARNRTQSDPGGGVGLFSNRNYNGGKDDTSETSSNSSGSLSGRRGNSERIITVTSCRSDAYHDQRALGATSKLPRRAPSALKTFHELAVGIKDAYEAGGCVPMRPPRKGGGGGDNVPAVIEPAAGSTGGGAGGGKSKEENGTASSTTASAAAAANNNDASSIPQLTEVEWEHQRVLFEFMGNLDFLLALVDEVAIDTATRGALKEDTTFRGLRDVIKKCNKVLESMLVRRERKYTLMFRIVSVSDGKLLKKISHWNTRVEKALGGVVTTDEQNSSASAAASSWRSNSRTSEGDDASYAGSEVSSMSSSSARSSVSAVLRRGRELLPTAGKVRARRATPTPRLRRKNRDGGSGPGVDFAGEDGYSSDTVPMTTENLEKLQLSLDTGAGVGGTGGSSASSSPPDITELHGGKKKKAELIGGGGGGAAGQVKPMKPKDELLDVIRGLRSEQMRARDAIGAGGDGRNVNVLDEIKSNFTPKAEIPSAVPKLPIEYIHRHRLMKQVVNCLLDRATGPRDTDDESPFANTITCITSRHSDKAGNGKTTLAVAAIQTVEVREFFTDGIAWIHLGRTPLGEREIRRLYEQLYDQLLSCGEGDLGDDDEGKDEDDNASNSSSGSSGDEKDNNHVSDDTQQQLKNKDPPGRGTSTMSNGAVSEVLTLASSRQSFQGGELEGMKEDLGRLLLSRRILICLDDVCKMEDAKWFLFGTRSDGDNNFEDTPHRVLITTRIPGLVGPGITHEVFVRIFTEHEAVKLLLTAAGRRPNGLPKVSPVFAQARIIVKGCGNSPLALRIAGGCYDRGIGI